MVKGMHMDRWNARRATVLAVVVGLLAAGCNNDGSSSPSTTSSSPESSVPDDSTPGRPAGTGDAPRLFGLRLSEGEAPEAVAESTTVVSGDELTPEQIAAVTSRLPDWVDDGSDAVAFNWPIESRPPPRTGATIEVTFPTDTTADAPVVPVGPLQVLRVQPEGDVPIAPYVSITFDQPMVAVGTVAQVDGSNVPVRIEPEVPGGWQWIGTRTVRFDADSDAVDRLPMATEFTVTVPAGTTSATGGVLEKQASFTFTTPAPTVQSFTPENDQVRTDQVFVATFDQLVDPAAVLGTVHVRAGDDEVSIRPATSAEVEADDAARMITEGSEPDRWVAFRSVDPLPTDTAITVDIGPGTPSAEGPLTTSAVSTHRLRTYAPLRVRGASCGYGGDCPPGTPITIEMNNPIDVEASDLNAITVSPALAGQNIGVYGSTIQIQGRTVARTEYTIVLPANLTDVYGQTLGSDVTETVTIGDAPPSLQPLDVITTLDPLAAGQQLTVVTTGHEQLRVRVYAADPSDPAALAAFLEWASYRRDDPSADAPAWVGLDDRIIDVAGGGDGTVEQVIDLEPYLKGAPGQVIVQVDPEPAVRPNSNDYWQNRPVLTWAQSTTLGVDAVTDADELLAWATDLRTGAPLEGVSISSPGAAGATTDRDGLARIELPVSTGVFEGALVASKGDEYAALPVWAVKNPVSDSARWYVLTDRRIYRPGETMQVKGWVRRFTDSTDGRLLGVSEGATVAWSISDSYGNPLADGNVEVGALGGFDMEVAIPATANVGQTGLQLQLNGEPGVSYASTWEPIQIEQYRRPEFEVTTTPETQPPFVATRPVTVRATGAYYAGGALPAAPVDWLVGTSETSYSPPGWDGYTFGIFQPWWYGDFGGYGGYGGYDPYCCGPFSTTSYEEYHGTTDASGSQYVRIDFEGSDGVLPDLPVMVSASATITDVDRQAWASTSNLLVHAADRYVGLQSSRPFVKEGDPLEVDVVVTDVDGTVQPGSTFDVTAGLVEQRFVDGQWTEVVTGEQTCSVTSAADPVPCSFDTPAGGQYRVRAVVTDASGGRNRSELTVWVSGATSVPTRGVDQQPLTVVPDAKEYAPGQTAQVLVQAPFATGEGLATVSRNGLRDTIRFTVTDGTAIVPVPITDDHVPQLTLGFEVVGSTTRTADDGTAVEGAPPRPAYATGGLVLSVPPRQRVLDVSVVPRDTVLLPGGQTTVDVTVRDSSGAPVPGAEFAVAVVDEAVLGLTGFQLADPLSVFYAPTWDQLQTWYARQQIRLTDPTKLASGGGNDEAASETTAAAGAPTATDAPSEDSATGGAEAPASAPDLDRAAADGSGNATAPVDVRSEFDALALFEPTVVTDGDGAASIPLTLPDTLTRYRVMVVAVSGADHFGRDEADITARLPLSVRPSAPRFANYGDTFELPVVVQNQGDQPIEVDVVLQTSNLVNATGDDPSAPAGRHVLVPANDRVEVRFPVAADEAGTATVRVAAVSGDMADASTVTLPVFTPATAEAFATYGVVDDGAVVQPVLAPVDVVPGFGGLEITTSSTSLQAITDAVLYLTDYRYGSSDGFGSRIIGIASLHDVLDAFDTAGLPSQAQIDDTMTSDIASLVAMQNDNGTFPFWRRNDDAEPFNTVQVAHAFVLARAQGYTVPQDAYDRVFEAVRNIESYIPAYYGEAQRDAVRAYAVWVSALGGRRDSGKAEALFDQRGQKLGIDALAWIWGSIDDSSMRAEIERTLGNRAVETAGAAHFVVDYGDGASLIMQSDHRTDAIVLAALIDEAPDSDLIPKVVNGLLASRVQGQWQGIQENTFVLVALRSYFDVFEAQTPDFVARVWLGDRFAGEHAFQGRETDRARIDIPTADLIAAGDSDIVVSKDGAGRLTYRIGLRYAPADLQLDALDRGFTVARTYEAVDDPADVTRDADGTWRIRAGARVRVSLTMVADSERAHVALVDPLPAGLESLNPDLVTTPPLPVDQTDDGGIGFPMPYESWWWGRWYDHEQLRDDRTEAFAAFLGGGTYTYSYVARATTPGSFVAPPTRAEEMYSPETFGRSSTDRVVVTEI
jgi:alpha-2-macroglobulin